MSQARRAPAPAKVNLALAVVGRRDDGFHTLRSVFLRIALHDDLEAGPQADPKAGDDLLVTGDPRCPVDDNLVLRAARSLRDAVDDGLPGLAFELHKRIPVAAGLGGGSSDAAAALELAVAAWGLRLQPSTRRRLALTLGADVPFFAAGHGAAVVSGIGERLEPLPAPDPPAGLVLVTPERRLSTARVFQAHDEAAVRTGTAEGRVADLARLLRAGVAGAQLASLARDLRPANDLWPAAAALAPELAGLRDRLEAELGQPFLLTGSGPTLMGLSPSPRMAQAAAGHLMEAGLAGLEGAIITATSSAETLIGSAGGR